jgi:hypothetical protein
MYKICKTYSLHGYENSMKKRKCRDLPPAAARRLFGRHGQMFACWKDAFVCWLLRGPHSPLYIRAHLNV